MGQSVVFDCAGALMGGAARFVGELDQYLLDSGRSDVTIVGRGEQLDLRWLARRERLADRRARRVASNNVSFVLPGGRRTVQLRNALHFADDTELAALGYTMPRTMALQARMVRATARRADRIVVPCAAMAERVVAFVPAAARRIAIRPHPVRPRPWAGQLPTAAELLVPILDAPYKRLPWHLENILRAAPVGGALERVHVTATPEAFPEWVRADPRVNFVGRLTAPELDRYWERSRAIYFPTQLESFGYPLAEARANGRRVVALDTAQNREIAGGALAGFDQASPASLTGALEEALTVPVSPDPAAFDPASYFEDLLGGSDA